MDWRTGAVLGAWHREQIPPADGLKPGSCEVPCEPAQRRRCGTWILKHLLAYAVAGALAEEDEADGNIIVDSLSLMGTTAGARGVLEQESGEGVDEGQGVEAADGVVHVVAALGEDAVAGLLVDECGRFSSMQRRASERLREGKLRYAVRSHRSGTCPGGVRTRSTLAVGYQESDSAVELGARGLRAPCDVDFDVGGVEKGEQHTRVGGSRYLMMSGSMVGGGRRVVGGTMVGLEFSDLEDQIPAPTWRMGGDAWIGKLAYVKKVCGSEIPWLRGHAILA
ncbi:hypothetical protein BDZ91DRAFT_759422 [Kalaharituber pfeilii]|nr:hypothetical protein BDZ91DRAFT_759422 [Kalaharituber pfeilii]